MDEKSERTHPANAGKQPATCNSAATTPAGTPSAAAGKGPVSGKPSAAGGKPPSGPRKPSAAAGNAPESPYVLMYMAVFGAVLFTVGVAIFSVQSHKGYYVLAAVCALLGLLLFMDIFRGGSDRRSPSALMIVVRVAVISIIWITLLSRVREHIKDEWLWWLLLIATLLVFLFLESLRRTTICILILVFCYFLSAEFFHSRHDLRSGLLPGTGVFKDAARKMLSARYFRTASTFPYTEWHIPYAKAVDPRNARVKMQTEAIVRGVSNEDKQEMVYRIFEWVTANVKYRSDPAHKQGFSDYIKPPLQTMESHAGDCDDTSVLLASLLESVGFNTYLLFVPGHVLVLVELEAGKPYGKIGAPYGYINGNPVFALESTRDTPVVGYPWQLRGVSQSERRIAESVTGKVVQLDAKE